MFTELLAHRPCIWLAVPGAALRLALANAEDSLQGDRRWRCIWAAWPCLRWSCRAGRRQGHLGAAAEVFLYLHAKHGAQRPHHNGECEQGDYSSIL